VEVEVEVEVEAEAEVETLTVNLNLVEYSMSERLLSNLATVEGLYQCLPRSDSLDLHRVAFSIKGVC
jgi:hypothetical protein